MLWINTFFSILLSITYQDAQTGEMFGIPELHVKALEINAWLQQNASKSFNYVIVDDENVFFKSQQEHLVLTDEYDGLIVDKAKRAIEILNQ